MINGTTFPTAVLKVPLWMEASWHQSTGKKSSYVLLCHCVKNRTDCKKKKKCRKGNVLKFNTTKSGRNLFLCVCVCVCVPVLILHFILLEVTISQKPVHCD